MAIMYRFAVNSDDLHSLLLFSLENVLLDDLQRFDIDGRRFLLEYIFEEGGVGHESGVEFDSLPAGEKVAELFLVTYRENGIEQAGLYLPEELRGGAKVVLGKLTAQHPEWEERAQALADRFGLT